MERIRTRPRGRRNREAMDLPENDLLTITVNYRRVTLNVRLIQYVFINHNIAEFHLSNGAQYKSHFPIKKLEAVLGDEFIRVHRNYLVAVRAIHDVSDKVYLNNGESMVYAQRRKGELSIELRRRRQMILDRFAAGSTVHTEEEYHARYQVFDDLPIAFADIEIVLDNTNNAVDWIFRYGNEALARLEQTPLSELIGRTFSSVFPAMDEKWLKSYERAALYGQTLEIIDFSPEIDTYLNIICFPTQQGHCGCLLLNFRDMEYAENQGDRQNARLHYIAKILECIR